MAGKNGEIPISGILCPFGSLSLAQGDEHSSMRLTQEASRRAAATSLFGLAPAEVCLATGVTPGTGGLLPHRFTISCPELVEGPFDRLRLLRPSYLLSVALFSGSPQAAVSRQPALWCPDFPPASG